MTLLDHLAHGASHLPLSGHLLRLMVAITGWTVAFFATDTWLVILASTIAAGTALISALEMHEAAERCDSTTSADDEAGFGRAA